MEDKKGITISKGTAVCLVILVIAIIALIVIFFESKEVKNEPKNNDIYEESVDTKVIDDKKDVESVDAKVIDEEKVDEKIDSKNEDNEVSKKETKTETKVIDPYARYSDLKWLGKDGDNFLEDQYAKSKIYVENGSLYIEKDGAKNKVSTITGNVKYFMYFGVQAVTELYVLTDDNTLWVNDDLQKLYEDNYRELKLKDTVVDITRGALGLRQVQDPPYFLLKNGELINKNGVSYDELEGDFINTIQYIECKIYVSEDRTLSYYDDNSKKYVKIKDNSGNLVKMKDAFLQYTTEYNEVVKGKLVTRYFVVTQDNKLMYFDITEKDKGFVAKPYAEYGDRVVKDVIAEKTNVTSKIAPEQGTITEDVIKVTFEDGTSLSLISASRAFAKAN